jgi:hypothetical protein
MVDQIPLAERDSEHSSCPKRLHGMLDRGRRETISQAVGARPDQIDRSFGRAWPQPGGLRGERSAKRSAHGPTR